MHLRIDGFVCEVLLHLKELYKVDRMLQPRSEYSYFLRHFNGKKTDTIAWLSAMSALRSSHGLTGRRDHVESRICQISDLATLERIWGAIDKAGLVDFGLRVSQRACQVAEETAAPTDDKCYWLNCSAGALEALGDFSSAKELYDKALRITEASLGPDHPDVAAALNNVATLLVHLGEFEGAMPLYERALSIQEQKLQANDPDIARSLNNLARLLSEMVQDNFYFVPFVFAPKHL
eukprot:c19557_g1_i4.p1 GENE.c19557_g1_i4~~c19557_g1_i4.p1  ORF type:complete len:235 (-),score=54.59 c19557_g1_i4:519-1223(-)